MSSLERILPFLSPISDLLVDPEITEVMVNAGGRRIFVERGGTVEPILGRTVGEKLLTVAIKNIARTCGDEISEEAPILDARLEDGSRVAAMFPPCSVGGPTLTIRRFTRRYSLDDLVDVGSLPGHAAGLLRSAVASRQNVLISGGTGTGKTTLLNALTAVIPDTDRIALIEETSEIVLGKPNYVRFEARRERAAFGGSDAVPAVTIADLLRATLRHRPDRIIVGEVRGAEAFDLLQALNTGHLGSMTTIHSNSARQALTRLAHCVVSGTAGLPHSSVREAIALAIDLVVHIDREGGQRRISELLAVHSYEPHADRFVVEHLYTHGIPGR
jgi:pilus assembly protein CpaF